MRSRSTPIPKRAAKQRDRSNDRFDFRQWTPVPEDFCYDLPFDGALLFSPPSHFEEGEFFSHLARMGYKARTLTGRSERWVFADSYDGRLFRKGLTLFRSYGRDLWHLVATGGMKAPASESSELETIQFLSRSRSLVPLLVACFHEQWRQLRNPSAHSLRLSVLRWEFSAPFGNQGGSSLSLLGVAADEGVRIDLEYFSMLLVEKLNCRPFTSSILAEGLAALALAPPGAPLPHEFLLSSSDTVAGACRKIIGGQVFRLKTNLRGALADLHPEYVHNMRVAIRRLRSSLRILAPVLPAERSSEIRATLASGAQLLGGVRDFDVLLDALPGQLARIEAPEEFREGLLEYLGRGHDEAIACLRKGIDATAYETFLEAIVPSLRIREGAFSGASIVPFAESRIEKIMKGFARWTVQPPKDATEDDLHTLRILCKRLRYTCEFFLPLGGKPLARLINACVSLQDCLGIQQDARVAIERLTSISGESRFTGREAMLSIGALIQIQRERQGVERERLESLWRSFRRASEEWRKKRFSRRVERNGTSTSK